ncbi:MAG: creatininase family protein [Nitrososphaeria archaeon]|nr:creatininase family protein [Nitrososphaeria archaeon]
MQKVSLDEMTREEFKNVLEMVKAVVVPVGSIEQHGPHLPMKHDLASVLYVARKAVERVYPKIILAPPPLNIGISPHHMNWPGTLTVSNETFMNVIFEVCKSLRKHGIGKVILLNGHGGNVPALRLVGFRIRDELKMKVAALSYWDLIPKDFLEKILEEDACPGHSGEFETSIALVIHPELVRKDLIPKGGKRPSYLKYMILNQEEVCPNGIDLDPSLGNKEKGEKILKAIIDELEKYFLKFAEI